MTERQIIIGGWQYWDCTPYPWGWLIKFTEEKHGKRIDRWAVLDDEHGDILFLPCADTKSTQLTRPTA